MRPLAAVGLSADKSLVGALDSACNRTCAGEQWIREYLAKLTEAPREVQALVKEKPETENFKFGNGGVLPSATRWRIPAVIGGQLVCVWVSTVPVPSLGLLLGRDVLDGLGGVLDFSERTLMCRVLGQAPTALVQLAAGHLAVSLIPEQWPGLTKDRWRRLGPDGVLEMPINCRAWAAHLMKGRSTSAGLCNEPGQHSHNLTGASLTLGQMAFDFHSVLTTLAQSNMSSTPPVSEPDILACAQDLPEHGLLSTASATDGPQPSAARPGPRRERARVPGSGALEEIGSAKRNSFRLESGRASPVVRSSSRAALVALSLSFGLLSGAMALAGFGDGGERSLSPEMAVQGHVQCQHFGFDDLVSQPSGPPICVRGGPDSLGHVGFSVPGRQDGSFEGGCDQRRSQSGGKRGRASSGGSGSYCAQRWAPYAEGGPHSSRSAPSRAGGGQGLSRQVERQDQAVGVGIMSTSSSTGGDDKYDYSGYPFGGAYGVPFDYFRFITSDPSEHHRFACATGGKSRAHDLGADAGHECYHVSAAGAASRAPGPHGGYGPALSNNVRTGDEPCNEPSASVLRPATGGRRDDGPSRLGGSWTGRLGRSTGSTSRTGGMLGEPGPGSRTLKSSAGDSSVEQIVNSLRSLKPGQKQLVTQAWDRHRRDQLLISCSARQIREAMEIEYWATRKRATHEAFVMEIPLLCSEIYSDTEPVVHAARRRGHSTGTTLTLSTGWDFRLRAHRQAAIQIVRREQPYFLVLAFPCGPWSPLQNLSTPPDRLRELRQQSAPLVNFAARLARE